MFSLENTIYIKQIHRKIAEIFSELGTSVRQYQARVKWDKSSFGENDSKQNSKQM